MPHPKNPSQPAPTEEAPELGEAKPSAWVSAKRAVIARLFAPKPKTPWDKFNEAHPNFRGSLSVPHEDLFDEETTDEDPVAALQRLYVKPIPRSRLRVNPALYESDVPEVPKRSALDEFREVVPTILGLGKAFHSLTMVSHLLKDSYAPGRKEAVVAMGFDQANLHRVMQAVFSVSSGKFYTANKIQDILGRQKATSAIFYYDLLGLTDHSDKKEMERKSAEFYEKIERLDELLSYPSPGSVIQTLEDCRNNRNPKISAEKIVRASGFTGDPILFDETDKEIDKILEEVKKNQSAAPAVAAPKPKAGPVKPDYADLYKEIETQPVGIMLRRLFKAFSAFHADENDYDIDFKDQYFNGDDLATVVDNIDSLFEASGIRVGLGSELLSAGTTDTTALIKKIAENFKVSKSDAIRQKLAEVYQIINIKYPHLSPSATPAAKKPAEPKAAATAAKAPAVSTPKKATIDFDAFYDEIEADPALSAAYPPFYHLFYALRRSEADYNAKQKNQIFGGEERDTVMADIDITTENGLSMILQEAATKASKDEYLTALIKAVAEHYGLTQKPEDLKSKILEIGSALGRLYPKLKNL